MRIRIRAVGAAMLGVLPPAARCVSRRSGCTSRWHLRSICRRSGAARAGTAARSTIARSGGRFRPGRWTMPRQLDIIERQVADAVGKGARVLCGDDGPAGFRDSSSNRRWWWTANHTMDPVQKETFGPVMTIIRVRDEEERFGLANDTSLVDSVRRCLPRTVGARSASPKASRRG